MRRCCDLDTVCSRRNLYSSLALPAPHVPSSLTEVFAAQAEPEPEPEPVATSAASARWGGLSAALGPGAGGAEDPEARAARVAAAFAAAAGDTESAEILAIKGKLARVKASLKAHAEVAEEGVPPVRFISPRPFAFAFRRSGRGCPSRRCPSVCAVSVFCLAQRCRVWTCPVGSVNVAGFRLMAKQAPSLYDLPVPACLPPSQAAPH